MNSEMIIEEVDMQNNYNKGSEQSSLPSRSSSVNTPPFWCSLSGSQVSDISYYNNVNLNMDILAQHTKHAKQLGFQIPDQYSSSNDQSHQEGRNVSILDEQCISSQSGTDASEKKNEDHAKSELPLGDSNTIFPHPKLDYNHSTACFPYLSGDPYYMGVMAAYESYDLINSQMLGTSSSNGVPLRLNPVEDPIYVNPKQYHRILQRRRARAKLEAQNKITKERTPYIHESRHVHALNRARGSRGRFLNMKQQSQTYGTTRTQDVSSSSLQHTMSSPATPTFSEITSVSNSSAMFQQRYHSSFSSGIQSHIGGKTQGGET